MEIDISGRHFQIGDSLKHYVTDKITKLDKFGLKLESFHVIMEVQKFLHTAEITALGKHLRIVSKADSSDMYAAFDKSFGSIQLQLRRFHDKVKDHKGRRYGKVKKTNDDD